MSACISMAQNSNVCPINSTKGKVFAFALFTIGRNAVCSQVFDSFSKDYIFDCQEYFGLSLFSTSIKSAKITFLTRYAASESTVCVNFASNAINESDHLKLSLSYMLTFILSINSVLVLF